MFLCVYICLCYFCTESKGNSVKGPYEKNEHRILPVEVNMQIYVYCKKEDIQYSYGQESPG
jgi:hypothetical protein